MREPDLVARGYAGGVPMGGDLPPRRRGEPRRASSVSALRDPGRASAPGAPLQRIQIVKGWVDADGEPHERVYDVAGDAQQRRQRRPRDAARRAAPAPTTLCTVWRDPDFDPAQPAFYYARVLENPSCRWTHVGLQRRRRRLRAAGARPARAATPCCDPALPRTIQERAWTSPIWYVP